MILGSYAVDDLRAQGLSDDDIAQVRAFAAFLRLPKNNDGKTVCPKSFYEYAMGGPPPAPVDVAAILEPDTT